MGSLEHATPSISDTRRTLLLTLASMGASSLATGVALQVTGRRSERDRAFARQFVTWGAINMGIAGAGGLRERFRKAAAGETEERRKLRRTLLVNGALDVGYIAFGSALILGADRVARRRYSADAARGDGAGIVVQGAMLLALDSFFALRITAT